MTFGLAFGLLFGLASACVLNWGYLAQHGQAAVMPPLLWRRPLFSLRLLLRNVRWLMGLLAGLAGWLLYVAALRLGPLSLVQAASAGGIGLLALLVWRTTGVSLSRAEQVGMMFALAGLALLGVSLAGQQVGGTHAGWLPVTGWVAVSLAAAALAAGPLARTVAEGAGLAIAAGVLFAAGDVATKAVLGGGRAVFFAPAALFCLGVGFVALQLSFQRGGVLATAGVASLFTNALPIAAGLALYREPLPNGALGLLRVLSFAFVVGGAAVLARREPTPVPTPAPGR